MVRVYFSTHARTRMQANSGNCWQLAVEAVTVHCWQWAAVIVHCMQWPAVSARSEI